MECRYVEKIKLIFNENKYMILFIIYKIKWKQQQL
jgi:hypothetical protein